MACNCICGGNVLSAFIKADHNPGSMKQTYIANIGGYCIRYKRGV